MPKKIAEIRRIGWYAGGFYVGAKETVEEFVDAARDGDHYKIALEEIAKYCHGRALGIAREALGFKRKLTK